MYEFQLGLPVRALADSVRPHDMRLLQQLWHGGNLYPSSSGGPPWAVSDVPDVLGMVGRVVSRSYPLYYPAERRASKIR